MSISQIQVFKIKVQSPKMKKEEEEYDDCGNVSFDFNLLLRREE